MLLLASHVRRFEFTSTQPLQMGQPISELGFSKKAVSIQSADPLLDIRGALPVVALPACRDDIAIGVVTCRSRDDMLYDVVLPVQLAKAVEAAVLLAHHDSGPVFFRLEEVLRLKVRSLNGCFGHDDAGNLGHFC